MQRAELRRPRPRLERDARRDYLPVLRDGGVLRPYSLDDRPSTDPRRIVSMDSRLADDNCNGGVDGDGACTEWVPNCRVIGGMERRFDADGGIFDRI